MAESSDRRPVHGPAFWFQVVGFLVATLVLVSGVTFAVLRWLESTA